MANTFGSVTLNITKFNSKDSPINLIEQSVIADPTTPSAVNTILQGIGKARSVYSIDGYCSYSDLGTLLSNKDGYTSKSFIMYLGSTKIIDKTCYIETLDYEFEIADDSVYYSMTLIEKV